MSKIPVIFMGSPQVAVTILESLLQAGFEVKAVVTQPDKPSGRGQKLNPPPVKVFAEQQALKVLQPLKVKTPEFVNELKQFEAQALIVAAYGRILSQEILDLTPLPLNVHFSLLPKYRGASCVASAILNNEAYTGVTIMKVVEALDAGPILAQEKLKIEDEDSTGSLEAKLAQMGGKLLVDTLKNIQTLKAQEQDPSQASYAPLIKKDEALIDWNKPANFILSQIRAFTPWPIAFTFIEGKRLKIFSGKICAGEPNTSPGEMSKIDSQGVLITCGQDALLITEVQIEGKNKMSVNEMRKGYPNLFVAGKFLGK